VAVRFHLAAHVHTDIVAHSTDGFPVRTGEEFLAFLRAAAAFGAGRPEALGAFLAAHPHAQRFVEAPKPTPTSFAREAFFAGTAFTFTNAAGVSRHGRFRIRPDAGTEYLSDAGAATQSAASVPWPDSRPEIPFGTITLTARVDDQVPDRRKIIFDPVPRVEGIESQSSS
jgi:catalase